MYLYIFRLLLLQKSHKKAGNLRCSSSVQSTGTGNDDAGMLFLCQMYPFLYFYTTFQAEST